MARTRNKKKNDDNKNVIIISTIVAILLVITAYLVLKPSPKHMIDDEIGIVRNIINGNTLELTNGLKVQLLGIDQSAESSRFLEENMKGKQIRLKADTHDPRPYYEDAEKETVKAYVKLTGNATYSDVNPYMLINGRAGLYDAYCTDSIDHFRKYVKDRSLETDTDDNISPNPGMGKLMSEIELGKKMSPSTFLIRGETPDGIIIGTGFFINNRGLALTNYHVLQYDAKYQIFISDEDGNITIDRDRPLGRIIEGSKKNDYVIFTVGLDNGETVPYLPLAKKRPERGTKIGVVGNPAKRGNVFTSTYTTGQVSAIRSENNEIQITASITNGNSGGPICDFFGNVVGIAKSVALDEKGNQNAANINFGVDIMCVREHLNSLKDKIAEYAGK